MALDAFIGSPAYRGAGTMLRAGMRRAARAAAASAPVQWLVGSRFAGFATIFVLHHVIRGENRQLDDGLAISEAFLDAAIDYVIRRGYDVVSLATLHRRMQANMLSPAMVVFTFDDGYLNNATIASKIFEKHRVPWTLYLTTGFPDRSCNYWWRALEQAMIEHDSIEFDLPKLSRRYVITSLSAKRAAFREVRTIVQERQIDLSVYLRDRYGVDERTYLNEEAMSWSDVGNLLASEFFELAAHTVSHPFLSALDPQSAQAEIVDCRLRIRQALRVDVAHFAYPFGSRKAAAEREYAMCRAAGYATAATTIQRSIYAASCEQLHALPRLWLDGRYERLSQLDMHLSGLTGLRSAAAGLRSNLQYRGTQRSE
jgi:peptidoglycan/xylan/chitin deacetylase (PgdA/CDA1 family)